MKMIRQSCDRQLDDPALTPDGPDSHYEQQLTSEIPRIRGYIRSQISNPSDVEDLLQDTVVRSLQTTARERVSNPLAYGLQVARSVVLDHWRRSKRQPDYVAELPEQESAPLDQQHMERRKLEALSATLTAMPPLRRQVFLMRRMDGLSRDAIAAQLGLSEASVKKHITRAMLDIARTVEKHERDD